MNAGLDPKKAIRTEIRRRLDESSDVERAAWSAAIRARLVAAPWFADSSLVFFYMAVGTEVDLDPLAAETHARGGGVCFPRLDWTARLMEARRADPGGNFEIRRYDIPEPIGGDAVAAGELDVIVTPGLAFDEQGGRLGRGGGFYDRFLADAVKRRDAHPGGSGGAGAPKGADRPVVVGVCYEIQVIDRVPTDIHDVSVDALVTEQRLLTFRDLPRA